MPQSDALQSLFRDARDLLVILRSDRTLDSCNPAFASLVSGAQAGVDFMDLVPVKSRERVGGQLVVAAGGDEVMVEVPHTDEDGAASLVEYRFFPIDGGQVAGIGRPRGERLSDKDALDRARAQLKSQTRMLDEIQLELTQVPFIDPVTGVWNRMQVFERLTAEWSRCERFSSPLTLLLIDVPGLDSVRASEGRTVAEGVLKGVARRLKQTVRDHDIVGRSTGDQFIVVATHSDYDGARALSNRVRQAVTLDPVQVEGHTVPVDVRIGGATRRSEGVEILEDLFRVAEVALEDASAQDEPFMVQAEVA
ncbi:MAG: GGDEF domain-containing protein [Planctomycetota bacterium]|nr:GGDEF domain-containing protein [Planctomycetota bacterium]